MQQVVVDSPTQEVPAVEPTVDAAADQPADPGLGGAAGADSGPAGPVPRAVSPGLLLHAQAYNSEQQRVLSLWNAATPDSLLGRALDALGDAGWLRGGSDLDEAYVGLGGALLVAVGALEAARAEHPLVRLDGVEGLLGMLLAGDPVPSPAGFEHIRGPVCGGRADG